jgi:hypothetical protein
MSSLVRAISCAPATAVEISQAHRRKTPHHPGQATLGLGPRVAFYQNVERRMGSSYVRKNALGDELFQPGAGTVTIHSRCRVFHGLYRLLGRMIFAVLVKLPVPDKYRALHMWHMRMQERQA